MKIELFPCVVRIPNFDLERYLLGNFTHGVSEDEPLKIKAWYYKRGNSSRSTRATINSLHQILKIFCID